MAFPTLSKLPAYPLSITKEDHILKSPLTAGYQHRRPKFTRRRKMFPPVVYKDMTDADKSALDSFEDGEGLGAFAWTDPHSSTQYTVYLAGPIAFRLNETNTWDIVLSLEQV
jgi:hypothetical protein